MLPFRLREKGKIMTYVLAIGTNIGNRKENIDSAVGAINLVPKTSVIACSSIYETQPVGYDEQDDFYNAAVLVESGLDPHEMLGVCLGIEAGFGRVRQIKNGPRILDIDLIFAEGKVINSENLICPHPRYSERRFVLEPLLELFPDGNFFDNNFLKSAETIDGQYVRVVDRIDIK